MNQTTSPPTNTRQIPSSGSKKTCQKCKQPLSGQYVRTNLGLYHVGCFKCQDCGCSIVEQYFAVPGQDPPVLVCERDYFKRFDSICANCHEPIRSAHISALGKKFHFDHFTCSVCSKPFQSDDVYFEHDGKVFCQLHYLQRFAPKCIGCEMLILGQVIEITRDNKAEQWHPDCYSLHTRWAIELGPCSFLLSPHPIVPTSQEDSQSQQKSVEAFITHATNVLDAFEESTAECINNIVHYAYADAHRESIEQCARLIVRMQALLEGLKLVDEAAIMHNFPPPDTTDAQTLTKRVQDFFAGLIHNPSSPPPSTKILLTMVSDLASSTKAVLTKTFRYALQVDQHCKAQGLHTLNGYLDRLSISSGRTLQRNKEESIPSVPTIKRQLSVNVNAILALGLSESQNNLNRCPSCLQPVTGTCILMDHVRYHQNCFTCVECKKPLSGNVGIDTTGRPAPYCESHGGRPLVKTINVGDIDQWIFLMRHSLAQTCFGLGFTVDEDGRLTDTHSSLVVPTRPGGEGADLARRLSNRKSKSFAGSTSEPGSRSVSPYPVADEHRISIASETDSEKVDQGSLTKQDAQTSQDSLESISHESFAQTSTESLDRDSGALSTSLGSPTFVPQPRSASLPPALAEKAKRGIKMREGQHYLSELSGLAHLIVKNIAVNYLHPLVEQYFTWEQLTDLVESKKGNLWDKIVLSLKGVDKRYKRGTFGVPVEELTDACGTNSELGAGPGTIRIPKFVDICIRALQVQDLRVEGIFRKNGNIKRAREFVEALDKDPESVGMLVGEKPIQLAALLRRWIRELPEPLLTFELHKLFVVSQKLDDREAGKKVLHYACCLLPKPNRDVLEVLLVFLRYVSKFAEDGPNGEAGNKMDVDNLATVIAPNLLASKGKDPAKDETYFAVQAVKALIEHQDEFNLIPEDIRETIRLNENLPSDVARGTVSVKDLPKHVEGIVKRPVEIKGIEADLAKLDVSRG